jgi:Methyltransferase domain
MFNFNQAGRAEFIQKLANPQFDPCKEAYQHDLRKLNEIVQSSGEPLEGNIFYKHLTPQPGDELEPAMLPKRRAFAMAAMMFHEVMEIGFNAGHSALLLLTANPQLRLTCVDLCQHTYTVPCFEYLKNRFGDRIELIQSNSLLAFPLLASRRADFGLYIIDGGHGLTTAEVDLFNVIQFGRKGSVICFDDSDSAGLRVILNMYMLAGKIINIADQTGFIKNLNQMFFVNNKAD